MVPFQIPEISGRELQPMAERTTTYRTRQTSAHLSRIFVLLLREIGAECHRAGQYQPCYYFHETQSDCVQVRWLESYLKPTSRAQCRPSQNRKKRRCEKRLRRRLRSSALRSAIFLQCL